MNAFALFACRSRANARHRTWRRLGQCFEWLEPRRLLAGDAPSSQASGLAPFTLTGSAFTGGAVAIPAPAVDTAQVAAITGGYTPQQLRHAYGLDPSVYPGIDYVNPLDGSGQTIAIIELYDDPYIASELANFDAYYGLPNPILMKYTQSEPNGAPLPANSQSAVETALDVEWAHAMAPGADIELVEGNPDDFTNYPPDFSGAAAFMDAVVFACRDSNVSVVSMSYGWSQTEFTQYGYHVPDGVFVTPAGHQVITFVAASGDRDISLHHYDPSDTTGRFPAESPNVVGVGATVVSVDSQGDWLGEAGDTISGGGYADEPEPAYQQSAGIGNSLGVRESPDVAWTDSQFMVCSSYNGGLVQFPSSTGTSASAPQFAGFMADVDQGRSLLGEGTLDGASQTLPLLYELQSSFHEITQFAPQGGGSPAFSPQPGYNMVTGLGTPNGDVLVPQLIEGDFLSLNAAGGYVLEAAEGQPADGKLATFVDPNGTLATTMYSATVDWGDGSSSTCTIGVDASGNLAVFGNHVYQQPGQFTVTVTIGSNRARAPLASTVQDTATVSNPPLQATGGFNVSAMSGQMFTNQVVATFTDPNDSGSYSSNVDFGDGSSAPGTIVAEGGDHYEVLASHAYTSGGPVETISVTITRNGDDNNATVESTATVLGGGPMPDNLEAVAEQLTHNSVYYGAFVTWAYQQFLGRTPDVTGLLYWVGQLQDGMTDEQLESQFLSTPEYIADHGGSDVNWVIGMYHDLLGRAPDGQGLAHWTSQIASGVSEYTIALGFAASAEREAIVISQDYLTYLGRTANQNDINYWVNQFLNGARNEDVIAGFIGSPEYYGDAHKGAGNRTTWLDSAFEDLYQRPPTASELDEWLAEMQG